MENNNLRQRAKKKLLRVTCPNGKDYWLTILPQTKDKFKMLRILDAVMRLRLEVTLV